MVRGSAAVILLFGGRVEERTCLGSGMGIHTNGRACTHADRDLKKRQLGCKGRGGAVEGQRRGSAAI